MNNIKLNTNKILLSICIPSITNRLRLGLEPIIAKLSCQIQDSKEVEVISLVDNKSMSVGRKRQALFQLARGKFVCQIDDDDDVEDDFVKTVLDTIKSFSEDDLPEVISYEQICDMDGSIMFVECGVGYRADNNWEYDEVKKRTVTRRCPWHWCCWRNDIAKLGEFYDCNGVEDGLFPRQMKSIVTKEFNIPKVLIKYKFRTSATQSPYFQIDPKNPPKICSLKINENEQ